MKRDYLIRAAAVSALALLAACGGGSSDSDGSGDGLGGGGGSGNFTPDIPGASNVFLSALDEQTRIFEGAIVNSGSGSAILPISGSATYTGNGTIFDSSLTAADDTVAELRNRALVVTDVTATLAFDGAQNFTVEQGNFRNIEGNAVSGQATWTGTLQSGGTEYVGSASGTIAGTTFATPANGAIVQFYGSPTDSAIIGAFEGGTGSGGTFNGVSLNGTIAAERN